jgi:hypothetical protein
LVAYVAALIVLHPTPGVPASLAWRIAVSCGLCLWFTAYAVQPMAPAKRPPFLEEAGNFVRVWGSTLVPYPKGQSNLDRIEAKDPRAVAVVQLKGVKLVFWGRCIGIGHQLLLDRVPAPLRTTPEGLVAAWAHGTPHGWAIGWLTLVVSQFLLVLSYTWAGHCFIGWCRMCGYGALRNTYKPLYAQNVSEFYNRFYFYFKELLADFFFFPTYLRFFKKSPRVRMFVATFVAAGIGNFLYHFLRDIDRLETHGFAALLGLEKAHAFYCAVLATAVALTNLRILQAKKRTASTSLGRRVLNSLAVFVFFTVLGIFDTPESHFPLRDYLTFAVHLVAPWTTHG